MSRSKNVSTYEDEWWTLVEAVKVKGMVELEFESSREANDQRLTWYGFVRALRESGDETYNKTLGIMAVLKERTVTWIVREHRTNGILKQAMAEFKQSKGPKVRDLELERRILIAAGELVPGEGSEHNPEKDIMDIVNNLSNGE